MNKLRRKLILVFFIFFGAMIASATGFLAYAVHKMQLARFGDIFDRVISDQSQTWVVPTLVVIAGVSIVGFILFIGLYLFLGREAEQPTQAARGGDDGSSPEAEAGRTVPPSGHSESKRSATPRKSKVKVICLFVLALVLAFGVVAYSVNVATRYHAFTNQLSAVRGIHIGDSREEVKYRLGIPQNVLGPMEEFGGFGPSKPVYTVSGADNDVNKMPSTTKVEDYDEWSYDEPYSNVRLTVKFNKSGVVESLNLYSNNEKSYGWVGIVGLSSGDSEEKVLRLGQPSRQNLDGVHL